MVQIIFVRFINLLYTKKQTNQNSLPAFEILLRNSTLADQLEAADERQFFHFAFRRVDDAHNSHHEQKDCSKRKNE